MAVAPDGKRIASVNWLGVTGLWDADDAMPLRLWRDSDSRPSRGDEGVAAMLDGRQGIIYGGNVLCLWDFEQGRCRRVFEGHSDPICAVALTPGRRRAVSGGLEAIPHVWDLETGDCVQRLQGSSLSLHAIVVTPDGRLAVAACGTKLNLYDLDSGECVRKIRGQGLKRTIHDIALTSDGRRAVVTGLEEALCIWDLATGRPVRAVMGSGQHIAVTPDDCWAVTADRDYLRLWRLETGVQEALFVADSEVTSVSFAHGGKVVVAATRAGGMLILDVRKIEVDLCGCTGIQRPAGVVADCPRCGSELAPPPEALAAIEEQSAGLKPQQVPCLDLPAESFGDSRLLTACTVCGQPLRLNPFVART